MYKRLKVPSLTNYYTFFYLLHKTLLSPTLSYSISLTHYHHLFSLLHKLSIFLPQNHTHTIILTHTRLCVCMLCPLDYSIRIVLHTWESKYKKVELCVEIKVEICLRGEYDEWVFLQLSNTIDRQTVCVSVPVVTLLKVMASEALPPKAIHILSNSCSLLNRYWSRGSIWANPSAALVRGAMDTCHHRTLSTDVLDHFFTTNLSEGNPNICKLTCQ